MPPKRPAPPAGSGAAKKRARLRDQRTITVDRTGGSAARGNAALPPTIEVDKFAQARPSLSYLRTRGRPRTHAGTLQARSFEISAMQRSMKAAKEANTVRAFQSLPRHLRRRAASHNIRRLPTRLRAKALSEVPKDAAKPKKKTRVMLGSKRKVKGQAKRDLLFRRQRNKIWLETHIWHAKRMHMIDIWGHRLAEKPTAKAFRASYRASVHGALLHDASYFQYIGIRGPQHKLVALLESLTDRNAPSPSSKRYLSGTREFTTDVYADGRLVGPATFMWAATLPRIPATVTTVYNNRQLLVRVHPTIAKVVNLAVTRLVASWTDEGDLVSKAYEKEFVTFELTGRRATEVLKAVLKPVLATDLAKKAAWKKLSSSEGPGSAPKGMLFGLEVYDPRLSFPPKLDKSAPGTSSADPLVPEPQIAQVLPFWDDDVRAKLRHPRFTKREIDARRSESLLPGAPLSALEQDDRIPILVAQRTLSSTGATSSPLDLAGWTLTIPAGWGVPFWSSLTYSGTRVGGLRERAQQTYEAGAPTFPQDYPGTVAFTEFELRREAADKGYYDRRPPAKRPNYAKLLTKSPFRSDFETIVNTGWVIAESARATLATSPRLVPSRVARTVVEQLSSTAGRGVSRLEIAAGQLVDEWRWGLVAKDEAWRPGPSTALLRESMVRVRVTPCIRGAPDDLGIIYSVDLDRRETIVAKLTRQEDLGRATGEEEGAEDLCRPPVPESSMGRITSGGFSLARGKGHAVGVVALYPFLELIERDRKSKATNFLGLVLVRDRDGEVYRAATLELME